jgi:peptidoglycan/LPS O-acetylase OafA/YrhL
MLLWSMHGPGRLAVPWLLAGMGLVGSLHGPEPGYSLIAYHVFSPYMFAFAFGWLLRCVEEMRGPGRFWHMALFAGVGVAAYYIGSEVGERLVVRIGVAALVFWAVIACRRAFEADNKLNRAGWLLGDASYSIYLSHWFVLSGIGKAMGVLQPPVLAAEVVRALGVALSIAIGVWIFAMLEKPIDRWFRRGGSWAEIPLPRFLSLAGRATADKASAPAPAVAGASSKKGRAP